MDNERTADVLQVALASYDRKELRVQKNYLEEQNPVLACTCFLNGHKLLQELQQGHNFDIVVLCSQMEDMSSIEFMMELRKLEHKPLLMLFDEGRRKNSSALRMEDSGSCCCVERMELKNLLRELYRMPGQQWQRTEQQCQQLYHSWGIRIPDINCSYLTSAVGVVYGTSQKLAIRKEILQAVSEQYGVSVSAVDSGIRRGSYPIFLPISSQFSPHRYLSRSTLCSSGFSIRLIARSICSRVLAFFSRSCFNRSICSSNSTM